jgi:hypothetical protein
MKAGTSVYDLLGRIDWGMLAQQKLSLVEVLQDQTNLITNKQREDLDGILHLLDHIMDEAEAGGFPVVFLTEGEEVDGEV